MVEERHFPWVYLHILQENMSACHEKEVANEEHH